MKKLTIFLFMWCVMRFTSLPEVVLALNNLTVFPESVKIVAETVVSGNYGYAKSTTVWYLIYFKP